MALLCGLRAYQVSGTWSKVCFIMVVKQVDADVLLSTATGAGSQLMLRHLRLAAFVLFHCCLPQPGHTLLSECYTIPYTYHRTTSSLRRIPPL